MYTRLPPLRAINFKKPYTPYTWVGILTSKAKNVPLTGWYWQELHYSHTSRLNRLLCLPSHQPILWFPYIKWNSGNLFVVRDSYCPLLEIEPQKGILWIPPSNYFIKRSTQQLYLQTCINLKLPLQPKIRTHPKKHPEPRQETKLW